MSTRYVTTPQVITYKELLNEKSLAPSDYSKLNIKNKNHEYLRTLLNHPINGGVEIGSREYIKKSTHYFIRTKALTEESYLINYESKGIVPIRPQAFSEANLKKGDILISKDSNIGEVAILDRDLPNYMLSGGIRILEPKEDRYFLFALLKNRFFKEQLNHLISRGSTLKHAKAKFLDCIIPLPNHEKKDELKLLISLLVKAIIQKEMKITENSQKIDSIIEDELDKKKEKEYPEYSYPTFEEISSCKRVDTGLYSREFKEKIKLIDGYSGGVSNIFEFGFKLTRGQNLQVSAIGKSIYSETSKPNFYRLFLPTHLTKYGTVSKVMYIGNKLDLDCLETGDIVFGAEGFEKGRSIVIIEDMDRTITNIHGIVIKSEENDLTHSIFVRCFLNYLRNIGLIDRYAVGGNGGSLAMKYWEIINFPNFPSSRQKEIRDLYHKPPSIDKSDINLDNFEDKDVRTTNGSGILELDMQIKNTKKKIDELLFSILQDKEVVIDFNFYSEQAG
jgi:hypothetical protein